MNTPNAVGHQEKAVANPSKRARLDSLLFNGVQLGAFARPASAYENPKLPIGLGE